MSTFWGPGEFKVTCQKSGLDKNVLNIPCDTIQGYLALSLIALTVEICLGLYMLLLGYRLAQKQSIEYARVKKEIQRAQSSPSSDGLLFNHV